MKYFAVAMLALSGLVFAQDSQDKVGLTFEVTVTNLTKSQIFSPPVAIAHKPGYNLFVPGQPSSTAVYTMAEDGDNSMIIADAMGSDRVFDAVSAAGPLMPGQSTTVNVKGTYGSNFLTVAGMLVQTNDTFFAVRNLKLPGFFFKNGVNTSSANAQAYDAGSEANTEDCAHIPGPPCGSGGVRVTDGAEGYVYFAPGIAGNGDLAPETYDWRGPVAHVSVRITR